MLSTLNQEQLLPAKQTEGAVLVTAGAGSGKTRLLTSRILNLIVNKKIDPYNILAITFTNKAAKEMLERLEKQNISTAGIWVSTFHSMCARILRDEIFRLEGFTKYFTIYDTSDSEKVLKKIVTEFGYETSDAKNFACYIEDAKNEGLTPDEYYATIINLPDAINAREIYRAYQEKLKSNNALDFNDLLLKVVEVFTYYPDVLNRYQQRFKYIHVDEFQDTNNVQYKIVKMLAGLNKNIFIVGDEDQSIYGWRGANINNIANFIKDFENVHCFKLEQNYRSTKNILSIANKLIKNNLTRIEKTLWTENETGETPIYFAAYDEKKEAEFVVNKVYNLINSGVESSEIAVLFRVGALSRILEEKLLNYNIPYVATGIFKFFERQEVKNVLAYLNIVANSLDNESIKRIINFPKRGIGNASIDKIEKLAVESKISMYELIVNQTDLLGSALKSKLSSFVDVYKNMPADKNIVDLAEYVVKAANIYSAYNENTEEDNNRKLNIDQLLQSIKGFEHDNPNSELFDYLQSVSLSNDLTQDGEGTKGVAISTVHASKGLEFDHVFIIGCEEGMFPTSRALEGERDVEEERRLMYVAVTRARKQVVLTSAQSRFMFGARKQNLVSRFIKEMQLYTEQPKPEYKPLSDFSVGSSYNNSFGVYDNSYNNKMNNYAQKSIVTTFDATENVSTNLADTFVKKLSTQKNNYSSYTVGTQVLHPKFGVGTIIEANLNGNSPDVKIDFGRFGNKTLSLSFAPLQILKK